MSEELNASSAEPQEAPEQSLGVILKAAREARGMSVADVATALHLRPSIVKDIEADDFSNISSTTYVRGYVKNFARIVEADKQQVEACLARQAPGVSQPTMQSFSRKTVRQARDSRYQMVTWLVIVILLALMVFWWLQTSKFFNSAGVDFSKPTAEEVAASSAETASMGQIRIEERRLSSADQSVNDPLASDQLASDQLANESSAQELAAQAQAGERAAAELAQAQVQTSTQAPSESGAQANPATDAASMDAPNTQAGQSTPAAGQASVELALSADCWIQVKDATGKVLLADLRKAGQAVSLSGKAPFKLILGAPQAVTVTFNGEAVGLNEFPAGKVARFTLPKNG
ncbi:RodZ domain-containing protein [Shewanella khirikhana]|uniref:Cytoskeleton protein RodZ n=1 Tax=Shewanella khirikhana TaxID=1965282 RepID=A0ABM7DBN0_9GAMM|nr:RodZ domain-containing protein [Shewanella khirikhana]AZQ11231.1 Cytoskeleton protein RodZ [Shewanella khirikhana]